MKIYIAVKSYWPMAGGIQTVTKYMAEGLVAKGYQVVILTEKNNELKNEEKHEGVFIKRFEHWSFYKLNYGDKSGYQKYILENVKSEDVFVTVCAQSFTSEWFFPITDKIHACKIMYMHGMRFENVDISKIYSLKNFFKETFLVGWWNHYFRKNWKNILKYDACIHLYKNDSSYCYFKKHGFTKNYCIENSCDYAFFDENTEKWRAEKYKIHNPYFIQVANYDENKNQLFTLKAFLESDVQDFDLVFIGSKKNSYYFSLLKFMESIDINYQNHIHFLTDIDRTDTIKLIKNSYACLLSSHSEYFPISIVEGMACKKPFICTFVGEVPKFLGGHMVRTIAEMAYWLNYYALNKDYVNKLGEEAGKFAKEKMWLQNKIDEFETIILSSKERKERVNVSNNF